MILMGTIFRGAEAEGDLKQFLMRSGRQMGGLSPVEMDCIFGRNHRPEELVIDDADNDNDDCHIVKRLRPNPTWLQQVNGILDLTEPLVFDVNQGTNMDDPICL